MALIGGRGGTLPGNEEAQQLAGSVPMGQLGRLEEIGAEVVLSLMLSPFATAQSVSFDGGMYPR